MNLILETERLILRAWTLDDVKVLFELCRDSDVMRHIDTGKPYQSLADARRFLEWAETYQVTNGFCRWAAIEKASRRVIGSCGFARLADGEIELGYLFERDSWGRGFATEAARSSLQYGFETLKFARVIALTDPGHIASQHVLEKIGFTCEGTKLYQGDESVFYVATNKGENPSPTATDSCDSDF